VLQAFVVVLREGFEGFLIVAIILSYLRKTRQFHLVPMVYWGTVVSLVSSGVAGYLLLRGASQPLWEGVLGVFAAAMVTWLVIHMWRTAARLKPEMEKHLVEATMGKKTRAAFLGVFLFTVLMITREGMETALLLITIREPRIVTGILLGLVAAVALALAWVRLGHLINLKRFFQVTSIFLLLVVVQILIYSFHEFTEAGLFPHSEALHQATEPFSPQGIYGRWFSLGMVAVCTVWLVGAWISDLLARRRPKKKWVSTQPTTLDG